MTSDARSSAASNAASRDAPGEPVRTSLKAPLVNGSARPTLGLAGIDGGAHGQRDHPVAVEPGGQRVPDAADRLLELLALALDLLDLALELARHAVELAPELCELVFAVNRYGMGEVASAEPACRGQEGAHLPCQRTSDDHSRDEGKHQECEQQSSDQQPAPRNLVVDVRSIKEHRELDRRTGRLNDSRHSSPVAVSRQLQVTRIAAGAELGAVADSVDGGGQQGLLAKDGEVEAGQRAHAREKVVGVDSRDAELPGLAAADRQRSAVRSDSGARAGASDHLSVARAQDDRRDVPRLVDELPHTLLDAATGPKRRTQAPVRGDPAQLRLGALRGLVVDGEGGAQAGVDARIGLAGLAAAHQDKQHDRERDHGDDHDQREEQPEPGAEAHSGPEYSREAPPPGPGPPLPWSSHGAIAQLGERLDRTQEVVGSSPTSSTRRTCLHRLSDEQAAAIGGQRERRHGGCDKHPPDSFT